jgi:hypothetical protein
MTILWQRLYHPITSPDPVIAALQQWFAEEKYTAYDPFPGGMGVPIRQKDRIKLFVSPSQNGWVQVIAEPAMSIPQGALVELPKPFINIEILQGASPQITVEGGELSQFLSDEQLRATFDKTLTHLATASSEEKASGDITDELAKAHGIKSNFLMRQMTKQYLKKISKEAGEDAKTIEEQAKQALAQSGDVDWGREDVQALREAVAQLTLPEDWRLPEWKHLQIAYGLTRPTRGVTVAGDKQAQHAVPNASAYTPLFYAR